MFSFIVSFLSDIVWCMTMVSVKAHPCFHCKFHGRLSYISARIYPEVFELRRGPLRARMQWVMFYLKGAGIKLKADSAG